MSLPQVVGPDLIEEGTAVILGKAADEASPHTYQKGFYQKDNKSVVEEKGTGALMVEM